MPDKRLKDGRNNAAMQLGITLAGGFLFFILLGIYLDRKFETGILFLLIGVFLSVAYMIYELWKVNRFSQESEQNKKSNDTDLK